VLKEGVVIESKPSVTLSSSSGDKSVLLGKIFTMENLCEISAAVEASSQKLFERNTNDRNVQKDFLPNLALTFSSITPQISKLAGKTQYLTNRNFIDSSSYALPLGGQSPLNNLVVFP
jgi:hypothetical protein